MSNFLIDLLLSLCILASELILFMVFYSLIAGLVIRIIGYAGSSDLILPPALLLVVLLFTRKNSWLRITLAFFVMLLYLQHRLFVDYGLSLSRISFYFMGDVWITIVPHLAIISLSSITAYCVTSAFRKYLYCLASNLLESHSSP